MSPHLSALRSAMAASGRRPIQAVAVLMLFASLSAACGKKGPPLAPIVKMPVPTADFTARRSGDTVYLRLTVPASNIDTTKPADLSRIEIYAYTAVKEVEEIEARDMTLVSEIQVRRPPDPEENRDERDKSAAAKKPTKPTKPQPPEPGVDQGSIVTVTDVLTPESMKITPLRRRSAPPLIAKSEEASQGSKLEVPSPGPVLEAKPRRFYVAYGVNRSGQRGGPSPRFAVAFDALPAPPGKPRLETKDKTLEITWDPPAGAAAAIERPATDLLLPVTTRGTLLPVLPAYNVYLVSKSVPPGAPGAVHPPEMPLPLNPVPLTVPTFVDDKIEFGVERCYQVRTVNTVGATAQIDTATTTLPKGPAVTAIAAISESAPSAIACATAADTVPPPAPTGLAAVASSGAISLIWTGVEASDLAGYLVLRSSTPDGPLTPIFKEPIREATYRDTNVRPGASYVYAVVAVDTAKPPNQSPMSNKAYETAR